MSVEGCAAMSLKTASTGAATASTPHQRAGPQDRPDALPRASLCRAYARGIRVYARLSDNDTLHVDSHAVIDVCRTRPELAHE